MRIHFSTTAVFPAIRCRCGRSFSSAPFLRAFWTALPFCPFPTLAAFPTIRCRCGATFSSAPFPLLTKELSKSLSHLPKVCRFPAFLSHLPKVRNRPGPSVAPVPAFLFPAASFHLPKSRLPKVRNRPGPSVAPVPAFLFPAASFHLPKVCGFSAFLSHLPKVRNRPGPSVAPVPAFLFPAASFHLPKSICTVHDILPIRRCRAKRYIATTFSFSLCANPHQRCFSVVLPWFPAGKVPTKVAYHRHLLGFVIGRPASEAILAGLPLNVRPEGAGERAVSPPPSRFRYVLIGVRVGPRWSCSVFLPGRCREMWPFTVTFRLPSDNRKYECALRAG